MRDELGAALVGEGRRLAESDRLDAIVSEVRPRPFGVQYCDDTEADRAGRSDGVGVDELQGRHGKSDADSRAIDTDLEFLAVARLGFKRRLELVGADDWARPTPCTEWDVKQLVNHVVGSDLRYADLLGGGSADDYIRRRREETGSAPVVGSDAVEDWARSGAALEAAFRKVGAMERVVDYPWGPLRGTELLENRVVDVTIHTWDLARAVDTDSTLDEQLVRRCLSARVFKTRLRSDAGLDDVAGSLSEAARLQDRLLRASGRSSSWPVLPSTDASMS